MYTEEQMLEIARWIADVRHRKSDLVNAVAFYFFFPGTYSKYGADGVVHWAPDGEWGRAVDVKAGEYQTFRFVVALYFDGLTATEGEALLAVPVPGSVIGRWYKHGLFKGIIAIFSHEGKTYFKHQLSIEISSEEEIMEVPYRDGRRFDRTLDSPGRGGYLIIAPDGDLHFFNRRGHRYQTAARVVSGEQWRWPPLWWVKR